MNGNAGRGSPRGGLAGTAFGVAIASECPILGLGPLPAGRDDPDGPVRIGLLRRADLLAAWPESEASALVTRRDRRGRRWLGLDAHSTEGWLLRARGHGVARVAPGGEVIAYAPVRCAAWRWQRHLGGQVLPLVALLRGREILHASAVVSEGRAIVIAGHSGAGKSTLLAALLLRGADFLADDVVALDRTAHGVQAHPALATMNLRLDAAARLPRDARNSLGVELGRDEEAHRLLLLRSHPAPAPVGGAYFVQRSPRHANVEVADLESGAARRLLGATFNAVVTTRERLLAHLDVCGRLDRFATVAEVRAPLQADPLEVADSVLSHARSGRAGSRA